MEKIKVSFDFDGTMDRTDVQKYAKELIRRKIEVWICSARLSNEQAPSKEWNNDLYKIVKTIGINPHHIKFCSMINKYMFFINNNFVFHLDDNPEEVFEINKYTKVNGILLSDNEDWIKKCEDSINNKINNYENKSS